MAFAVFNWKFSILKTLRSDYKDIYAGFVGLAVGLVIAWIFNDSGIEAAGSIAVFLFVPYFLMLVHWRRKAALPADTG